MDKPIIIRNRPIEHYILSIFSLIAQGEKKIILESSGSINAKTLDMIGLISRNMLPNGLLIKVESKIKTELEGYPVSVLSATLRVK